MTEVKDGSFGNCLDFECLNCKKKWGLHSKKEASECESVLFIYHKAMELLAK